MRKPNTLPLDDFSHEMTDDEARRDTRRNKWVARTVGVLALGLIGVGVFVDQTELDGMITGGLGHEVGVLIHDAAGGVEDAARWVTDNTPAH